MTEMNTMIALKGKNIRLRPLEITDLNNLYEWENHPENWQAGTTRTPISRFFLEQYILNAQNNIYDDKQLRLIIENNKGEAVGTIDLFDFDPHNRRAGIGIMVGHAHRNNAYAGEALDLMLDYAHRILCLKQLYCTIEETNTKSLRLFKNKGFEATGKFWQWTLRENKWVDACFLQYLFLTDPVNN